jgi:hypothetical protein
LVGIDLEPAKQPEVAGGFAAVQPHEQKLSMRASSGGAHLLISDPFGR